MCERRADGGTHVWSNAAMAASRVVTYVWCICCGEPHPDFQECDEKKDLQGLSAEEQTPPGTASGTKVRDTLASGTETSPES